MLCLPSQKTNQSKTYATILFFFFLKWKQSKHTQLRNILTAICYELLDMAAELLKPQLSKIIILLYKMSKQVEKTPCIP